MIKSNKADCKSLEEQISKYTTILEVCSDYPAEDFTPEFSAQVNQLNLYACSDLGSSVSAACSSKAMNT